MDSVVHMALRRFTSAAMPVADNEADIDGPLLLASFTKFIVRSTFPRSRAPVALPSLPLL